MADNVIPYTLGSWDDYPVRDELPRPSSGEVPFVLKDWETYPTVDRLPLTPPEPNYNIDFTGPKVFKGSEKTKDGVIIKEPDEQPKISPATPPAVKTPPKTEAPVNNFDEAYIPQQPEDGSYDFNPATAGWFGDGTGTIPQTQQQQAQMTDPHRSLLQAIMGWDDVPYGKKWNHYLQHGLVGVSKDNVDNITKMAALENKGGLAGAGATYGQELRAHEQKRRTLMNQWDKLLSDWNAGRYAGDEQTVNWFYDVAKQLREEIAAEGINPNTLRPPSLNAGGFAQGFQKTLADDREKLDWLGGWLESIQHHASQDPKWLNSIPAQAEFDKLSEYIIINWAQSKGAIADAEKVRAQVETMPQQDRQVFDTFMRTFFNANTVAQLNGLAAKGDYSALQTIESLDKLLGKAERGESLTEYDKNYGRAMPNEEVSHLMDAAILGFLTLIKNQENIPIEVAAAVNSYKNAKDSFLEYTMQNANVDRKAVWDMAMDQLQIYQNRYNGKMPKAGLNFGWGYTPKKVDRSFGDYLNRWQNTIPPAEVMQNATLGIGRLPQPVDDGLGTGRGGRGGNSRR